MGVGHRNPWAELYNHVTSTDVGNLISGVMGLLNLWLKFLVVVSTYLDAFAWDLGTKILG